MQKTVIRLLAVLLLAQLVPSEAAASSLRVATFQADATPPLGSPLCNGAVKPAMKIVTPLTARGVVLLGAEPPIVLCAIDWVGIANDSYDKFREMIRRAKDGTEIEVLLLRGGELETVVVVIEH